MALEPSRARQVAHRALNACRQVQRLARERDLAAGDVDDVQEVVDQPAEMGDLMTDPLARAHRDVVVAADPIEDADRADNGGQRIAKLVTQHREKLVLRAIGGFGFGARGLGPHQQMLALLIDASALFDDGAGRDDHHRHGAHEDLQQHQRLVRRHARQRPKATKRFPDRDAGQHRDEHRGLTLTEAHGGPDERRGAQECERKRHQPQMRQPFAEHREPDERRREPEGGGLEHPAT